MDCRFATASEYYRSIYSTIPKDATRCSSSVFINCRAWSRHHGRADLACSHQYVSYCRPRYPPRSGYVPHAKKIMPIKPDIYCGHANSNCRVFVGVPAAGRRCVLQCVMIAGRGREETSIRNSRQTRSLISRIAILSNRGLQRNINGQFAHDAQLMGIRNLGERSSSEHGLVCSTVAERMSGKRRNAVQSGLQRGPKWLRENVNELMS
jgi:hypothetical protein